MRILKSLLVLGALLCPFTGSVFGQTVYCASADGHRHSCRMDTRNGVMLTKQVSGSACQQDYSWGYDERGIWVDHGCRAEFAPQNPAGNGRPIYCASDDGGKHYCPLDVRGGVALVKQRSGSACQQGYSWGYDERGIWVDHGCRADFAVQQVPSAGAYGANASVECSSEDWGRHYCQADTSGDVELLRQRSEASCIQGSSWGFDANGIWVDRGCRADFVIEPHERPEYAGDPDRGGQPVSCSSDDGGRHYCEVDARGNVQLAKQRSSAACQQGYSWGFDDRGIWVDHGCRADFVASAGERREHGEHHGRSCRRSVGDDRANQLVEQCLQVSPGTHPPCNAENSCKMITDEIRRSCMLLGADGPRYCDEYR